MAETVAVNRKARHDYLITDTFEAGLVLTGTEIKSVRAGKVNLAQAYARVEKGEAWLIGAHIAPYEAGNRYNHEPNRDRKLLLHRVEIDALLGRVAAKGLTVVPLRMYITGDTLFQGGPGATGRSHSDFPTIISSIRQHLLSLPVNTVVHTGHGADTTIGAEAPHLGEWIARGH